METLIYTLQFVLGLSLGIGFTFVVLSVADLLAKKQVYGKYLTDQEIDDVIGDGIKNNRYELNSVGNDSRFSWLMGDYSDLSSGKAYEFISRTTDMFMRNGRGNFYISGIGLIPKKSRWHKILVDYRNNLLTK